MDLRLLLLSKISGFDASKVFLANEVFVGFFQGHELDHSSKSVLAVVTTRKLVLLGPKLGFMGKFDLGHDLQGRPNTAASKNFVPYVYI